MKKNVLLVLILIFALSMTLFLTGCGGSSSDSSTPSDAEEQIEEEVEEEAELTLEKYVANDPDTQASIDSTAETNNLEISVSGNEMTYKYDYSKMDGVTEEAMKDPSTIDALEQAMKESDETFTGLVKDLEDNTGISGVIITVAYTWGDDILYSASYTASGRV